MSNPTPAEDLDQVRARADAAEADNVRLRRELGLIRDLAAYAAPDRHVETIAAVLAAAQRALREPGRSHQ